MKMAPAIMLLRIVIRINIVRCISVNKIEITVLSARVLDALSGRGLKAKTVHEFERYGTRRIVKHCLGKGQILYSKETVQNFVWQERAKQESGTLPHYQWGITRRAAVYLDQMAEYGKIQDTATTNSMPKTCPTKWHGKHCKAICLQICRKSRRNVCRRTFP